MQPPVPLRFGPRARWIAGLAASVALVLPPSARAQQAAPAPAPAASAPQRVEITGGRPNDVAERRQSTTTRIVIGRDDIDKFGDATLGEVLRRLPGVTTPGAPGRGGAPRLRGLGGGYTQILVDGERQPPGFSIESINPDQVERIEILRAPTAETGTRAIAGTINIVTREGFKRRVNDLRLGFGSEAGRLSPGLSWTRNDRLGPGAYNLSVTALQIRRQSESVTDTTDTDLASGAVTRAWHETSHSVEHRRNLGITARVQLPLNAEGDALTLQPSIFHTEGGSDFAGSAANVGPGVAPGYASATNQPASRFSNARLNGQWRTRVGSDWRLEASGGLGRGQSQVRSLRQEFDGAGLLSRTLAELNRSTQDNLTLGAKLSRPLGEGGTLLGGLELERTQRDQASTLAQNGPSQIEDAGDPLSARSSRAAAYGQYEWTISPNWSAYAGLRWEGIVTEGQLINGPLLRNRSSVWAPLAHAVWKPDPQGRDQLRISLTRSYRSPDLGNLIAIPRLNPKVNLNAKNDLTTPDSAGNPGLKPELATGLDMAFERYLEQGGLLSISVYHRRITDLIRSVVAEELNVPWAPNAPSRFVSRPQNIGSAWTQGLELEARFRLDQLLAGAPPTELRSNLGLFRSRVASVIEPDNRLAEQPGYSFNLGFDHRWRGTPLSFGGNANLLPAYRTLLTSDPQLGTARFTDVSAKRVFDAYALWTFSPETALRLLANNLAPGEYISSTGADAAGVRELATTTSASRVNLQLRLELKL